MNAATPSLKWEGRSDVASGPCFPLRGEWREAPREVLSTQKKTGFPPSFSTGADNKIRTYTVAHWILSPTRLPFRHIREKRLYSLYNTNASIIKAI